VLTGISCACSTCGLTDQYPARSPTVADMTLTHAVFVNPRCVRDTGRGQVATLPEPQAVQPRQLDRRGNYHHGAGEPKAAQSPLLGLQPRIAHRAIQLPLLRALAAMAVLGEGSIQAA